MAAPPEPDGGAAAESPLLRNQAAFVTVQDCLDFAAASALLCCSRLSAELLEDQGLYEASRHAGQQPAGPRAAPRLPLAAGGRAKLTWCFSQGLAAYEARDLERSERLLGAALELAPEDDVVLCRLADTCYARCRAEVGELREALEARTLELYRRAVSVNPASSLGLNGLSLFQEGTDAKRHYLLRAVALDRGNPYALTNLAMILLDEKDKDDICLTLLKRALAINPNLFYARPTIARLHLRLNELNEARAVLAEQVMRRPQDHDSRCLLELLRRIV
ncbi:unnamed protein product [Prorocentrum cordatum]|uniref:Uncharacterized protein n=1 Tax=Prorocentrum cordatum TaxID=2364126 RepID=A0ABN9TTJ9_9DINO|nr:unnamed protein product [Polarella glacialis]